jgi:hypothetical protein
MFCPISHKKINETHARIIASFVCFFSIVAIKYNFVSVFILFDFLARIFDLNQYSLLSITAEKFSTQFPKKMIDSGKNDFALKIGGLMSLILVLLYTSNANLIFFYLITLSIACATGLFAFFNYCLACKFFELYIKAKEYANKIK